MRMTVSKKLFAGFSSVLLILAIMVGISYTNITSVDNTYTHLIDDQAQKLIKLKELQVAAKQEVIAMRGYVILGDEKALLDYENAKNEYKKIYGNLSQMVQIPAAIELLKELNQIEGEYAEFANGVFELKRQNKTDEYTTLISTQGRVIVKRFDEKVAELTQFQANILGEGKAATAADVDWTKTLVLLLGVIAVIVGVAIALLIGRIISRPVTAIADVATKIADGDLTVNKIVVKNRDEIGELADSFNQMAENLRHVIQQVRMNSEQVAASAEQLTASSEQTSKATEQVTSTMQELAMGVDKQVQNVEETSQIINEMSIGVQQVASNAQHVSNTAIDAFEKATEGDQVIKTAVQQMNSINQTVADLGVVVKELGERSNHIGEIIEVITGIAAQTNLLALNAAIEAARAGEHGRGFAVVADEVRKLAEQSAHSSQQISLLISAIQEETNKAVQSMQVAAKEVEEGIGIVNTAGTSFAHIQDSVSEVKLQIQEVSSAVQQMAAGAEQIVGSMKMITEVTEASASGTQEISAATEEQLASMEEISSSASSLSQMADELQTLIRRFKV